MDTRARSTFSTSPSTNANETSSNHSFDPTLRTGAGPSNGSRQVVGYSPVLQSEHSVSARIDDVAGPDEHRRSLDHLTIRELDAGQPVGIDNQPRNLAAHDLHAASLQLHELR
jgi:hypothetical protein